MGQVERVAVCMLRPVRGVLQLGPGAALRLSNPLLALVVHPWQSSVGPGLLLLDDRRSVSLGG